MKKKYFYFVVFSLASSGGMIPYPDDTENAEICLDKEITTMKQIEAIQDYLTKKGNERLGRDDSMRSPGVKITNWKLLRIEDVP